MKIIYITITLITLYTIMQIYFFKEVRKRKIKLCIIDNDVKNKKEEIFVFIKERKTYHYFVIDNNDNIIDKTFLFEWKMKNEKEKLLKANDKYYNVKILFKIKKWKYIKNKMNLKEYIKYLHYRYFISFCLNLSKK